MNSHNWHCRGEPKEKAHPLFIATNIFEPLVLYHPHLRIWVFHHFGLPNPFSPFIVKYSSISADRLSLTTP